MVGIKIPRIPLPLQTHEGGERTETSGKAALAFPGVSESVSDMPGGLSLSLGTGIQPVSSY